MASLVLYHVNVRIAACPSPSGGGPVCVMSQILLHLCEESTKIQFPPSGWLVGRRSMDGVVLDPVGCTVEISGVSTRLSDIEYVIVERLASADGMAVSKYDLIRATWGDEMRATSEALRQRVFCLRRKVGRGVVRSVYGYGYRMCV